MTECLIWILNKLAFIFPVSDSIFLPGQDPAVNVSRGKLPEYAEFKQCMD